MAKLTVGVELDAGAAPVGRSHAIADVIYQGSGTQGRDLLDVPVALHSNRQTELGEFTDGDYVVQLRLPTGERATKKVSITGEAQHSLTFDLTRPAAPMPVWSTAEVQATLARAREFLRPQRVFVPADNPATDLMRIRGVGPALAKVLVDRGVNSIFDVAKMSPREIGWLGQSASSIRGTVKRFDITKGAADVISGTDHSGGNFEMGFASGLQTGGYGTGMFPDPLPGGEDGPTFLDQVVLMGEQPLGLDVLLAGNAASDVVAAASLRPFELDDTEGDARSVWAQIETLANSDDSDRSPDDLVQAFGRWDGDPAIVEGDIDGERSAITFTKGADLLQLAPSASRLHAIINDGHVSWLAPLPIPWYIPDDPRECTLSIVADRGEPWMTSVSMMPLDPVAGGLIAFLQSGDVTATLAILDVATERLYEKILNPFAAAAGALVLVQSKRWAPHVLERRAGLGSCTKWEEWVSNLCRWKGWLPDGFVLHAWLNLLDDNGDEQLARKHLLTAVKLGLPAYSGCFRLLVDGLRTLQSRNKVGDPEVDAALCTLDATALRIDPRQVFTMVRLTDPPSRSFSTLSANIGT